MSGPGYEQLTLFPADSPASHLVLPGSEEARTMTATSGRKCLELYRKSGPLGSLVRMLVGSSDWVSTRRYLTWRPQATKQGRLYYRLVPSTPPTDGIDARLWPTVTATIADHGGPNQRDSSGRPGLEMAARMWPTPTASDCNKRGNISPETRNGLPAAVLWPTPTAEQCGISARTGGRPVEKSTKLGTQVAIAEGLIPTPLSTDWKNRGSKESRGNREFNLQTYVSGTLNPDWVEWLMAFPHGWTDIG